MAVELNTLESVARDGSIDAEQWPELLQMVLERLDQIVHSDFPIPRVLPPRPDSPNTTQDTLLVNHPQSHTDEENTSSIPNSQATDKENAPPPPSSPPRSAPAPLTAQPNASSSNGPDVDSQAFPDHIQNLYSSVRDALEKNFPKRPPHTIQRLSELILRPRQHYRYLPSYLNALYRVMSVSSDSTLFPLPQAVLPGGGGGILNGTIANGDSTANSLGSDESLGGALLTPIPWLRPGSASNEDSAENSPTSPQTSELRSEGSEMVEGPNGTVGRIETVSVVNGSPTSSPSSATQPASQQQQLENEAAAVSTETTLREAGGVTQGELLRQEQEAGVIPITQRRAEVEEKDEEEKPHARGPEEMTMEDTGPTSRMGGRVDLDKAVGRSSPEAKRKEEGEEEGEGDDSNEAKEKEGNDIVVTDPDGKPAEAGKDEAMTDAPGEDESA